jgi:rhodanese-related sulfurtransferase
MERIPEFIGNHLFLVTLFLAILILLLWNLFGSAVSGVAQVPPAEATFLINRENAVVLDVRGSSDFTAGHILNALHIPETEVESRIRELQKHKGRPIVAVCSNGMNSARTARLLKNSGFERVYLLKGGIAAWQNASLPLTRGSA